MPERRSGTIHGGDWPRGGPVVPPFFRHVGPHVDIKVSFASNTGRGVFTAGRRLDRANWPTSGRPKRGTIAAH